MDNPFFTHPILNSPYDYPSQQWELDDDGQLTQQIIATRRSAKFTTPIPKPKKRTGKSKQLNLLAAHELTDQSQQYNPTSIIINEPRREVDAWRSLPNPGTWQVTPETARLLKHWRHHPFQFICLAEPLHLVVEIKSYRREDAKEKKTTMETYWIPGVNNLGQFCRWAFTAFTEVFRIEEALCSLHDGYAGSTAANGL